MADTLHALRHYDSVKLRDLKRKARVKGVGERAREAWLAALHYNNGTRGELLRQEDKEYRAKLRRKAKRRMGSEPTKGGVKAGVFTSARLGGGGRAGDPWAGSSVGQGHETRSMN